MNWLVVTFLFNIPSLSFPDPIRFKYPGRFDYPNYARILQPRDPRDSLVISIWIIDFSAHRNVVSKKGDCVAASSLPCRSRHRRDKRRKLLEMMRLDALRYNDLTMFREKIRLLRFVNLTVKLMFHNSLKRIKEMNGCAHNNHKLLFEIIDVHICH